MIKNTTIRSLIHKWSWNFFNIAGNEGFEQGMSVNTPIVPEAYDQHEENKNQPRKPYEFMGNRQTGNCSLRLNNVSHHDEGNWRYSILN